MTAPQDLERIRGKRLFVGTPMYDGKCHSSFAFSIAQLSALCTQLGVGLRFYFACNEALITKARNITADEFLRARDDTLLFVDSDIGFDARDAIQLLALLEADAGGQFDVLAAPYPLKRMAWDTIVRAAQSESVQRAPELLARYASSIVISPAHEGTFPINAPVEVTQAGTGFMMIRRSTLERYRAAFPGRTYTPERLGLEETASPEVYAYFETEIDTRQGNAWEAIRDFLAGNPHCSHDDVLRFIESEEPLDASYTRKYISEDYAFCRRVRRAGMKVWMCPWMELTHTGSQTFVSRLADLATIGML